MYRFEGALKVDAPISIIKVGSDRKSKYLPRMGNRPYFPATTLCGKLRGLATDLILDALPVDVVPFGLNLLWRKGFDYDNYLAALHGKARKTDGAYLEFKEIGEIRRDPILNLFGVWGVAASLYIDNGIPDTDCNLTFWDAIVRRVDERDVFYPKSDEAQRSLLMQVLARQSENSTQKNTIDAKIKDLQKKLREPENGGEEALQAQIQDLEQQKKQINKEDASIKMIGEPVEFFRPGVEFDHGFAIQDDSVLLLGFFLNVLQRFAANPFVGGHLHRHGGRLSGRWRVQHIQKNGDSLTIGEVGVGLGQFHIQGDAIVSAHKQFRDALPETTRWLCARYGLAS